MSLDRPTLEEIHNRMVSDTQARVTSNVRIPTASFLNIIVIVFTGAIHLVYGYLQSVLDQLFADTAIGRFLERLANIFGLTRKAATFAQGNVIFTGLATTVIPIGTQLVGSTGLNYTTTEEFTIGTTVQAAIIADEQGTESNSTDSFMALVSPLSNVDDTVSVVDSLIDGGAEQETYEQLRLRLLQRLQNPPASGSKSDYVRWALSTPGVDVAWTKSGAEYLGGGSVAIIVATAAIDPVGASVVADAQAIIDSLKPVGARYANVLDVTTQPVIYDIDITPYTQANVDNIVESLQRMHLLEADPGGTIYLSQVQAAIAETPLTNYTINTITIDGTPYPGGTDIIMTGFDVAKYSSSTIGAI